MTVSVIIPTRDRKDKLLRLIASVKAQDFPRAETEIIVVDSASSDGSADAVAAAHPDVRLVRLARNAWAAGGRQAGADVAQGELLFFVDDDNVLDPSCIRLLAEAMRDNPDAGVLAPLSTHFDDQLMIWCVVGNLDGWGRPRYPYSRMRIADAHLPPLLDGYFFPNAYMLRARMGGKAIAHDPDALPHNWSEADLCARVRATGFRTAAVTAALTHHDMGYSGPLTRVGRDKTYDQARSRIVFRKRHLNGMVPWLGFWLVVFPVSTAFYLHAFRTKSEEPFFAMLGAYLRGTYDGLCAAS